MASEGELGQISCVLFAFCVDKKVIDILFEIGERSNITLETLGRLAKALKVKPAELLK